MNLNDDHFCFVCGQNNSEGLMIKFTYPEIGKCQAEFIPPVKYQGWQGILHGGIVSTLLDEALAHAVGGVQGGGGASYAVTAELTIRFIKPVKIGDKITLLGEILKDRGRVVEAKSEIIDSSGVLLANATGKLVRPFKKERV
jgi:uncharacterized protein (TIGR00369 family)